MSQFSHYAQVYNVKVSPDHFGNSAIVALGITKQSFIDLIIIPEISF